MSLKIVLLYQYFATNSPHVKTAKVQVLMENTIGSDGLCPVRIRFYFGGNSRSTKTLFRIHPDQWKNGKVVKHPNAVRLNLAIQTELNKATEYILDCDRAKIPVDPALYFNTKEATLLVDILEIEAEERKKAAAFRTADKFYTTASKVRQFNAKTPIHFTSDWPDKYCDYWASQGNKPNTIGKDLKNIKVVLNKALKRGLIPFNPMQAYKIRIVETNKEKLSIDEIKLFQDATLPGHDRMAVDTFLFALFHWGMRAHDVISLRKDQIIDGRITYTTQKSSKRHEIDVVFMPQDYPGDYVFPYLSKTRAAGEALLRRINNVNSLLNKKLKRIAKQLGINKKVTMHTARHSFASIADEKGLSLNDIRELLGHSNVSTTANYIKSIQKSDVLNEKVKGLFS